MSALTGDKLLYAVQHVFLPPKLPSTGDDRTKETKDAALLALVKSALSLYKDNVGISDVAVIASVQSSIEKLMSITDSTGCVSEDELLSALKCLSQQGGIIPVHVLSQNAGLIIRRNANADAIVFEVFELLPPNEQTIGTKGRLKRSFPGRAVSVDIETFDSPGFRSTLAQTIAKMSSQAAKETLATATKAGQDVIETRDTRSPTMVTDFLITVLQATGKPIEVERVWKHTRDEVMWETGLAPWHRSPVWLLARVAMQTILERQTISVADADADDEAPAATDHYKEFMAFFMSHILKLACHQDMDSDLLHCMMCKISRRLTKLEKSSQGHALSTRKWMPGVTQILTDTELLMAKRWNDIAAAADPGMPLSSIQTLDFTMDKVSPLAELDVCIERINNPSDVDKKTSFVPPDMVIQLPKTLPAKVRFNSNSNIKNAAYYDLAMFESWVEDSLKDWLGQHLSDTNTCGLLSGLLKEYHQEALSLYADNPENMSIMVLTCMELWVACDKAATETYPLLWDYDPGIPVELLQSLLLPFMSQMQRLARIEEYVAARKSKASATCPSVFSSFGHAKSFPVRYFASSPTHQALLATIEAHAAQRKKEKLEELASLMNMYKEYMALHNSSSCTYVDVYNDDVECYEPKHSSSCLKCSYRNRAQGMSIGVYEWPLPRRTLDAQNTVFEIDCPPAFDHWRDASVFLTFDVLCSEYNDPNMPQFSFRPETCLSQFQRSTSQRLSLISETKPHVVTHRQSLKVSMATADDVCVNNGLSYKYYDSARNVFVSSRIVTDMIPKQCMYKLQDSPSLQDFLYRPYSQPDGPEPNEVIAQQWKCPDNMSLEEFKALASLPYGTRTQWSNLLVQLAIPSVDFKETDTYLVVLQMIHQAGPPAPSGSKDKPESVARQGHYDLRSEDFGRRLANHLQDGLARIQENWESYQALAAIIAIAKRLLSLTSSTHVTATCLGFLAACRKKALQWACELREKVRNTAGEEQRTEFLLRTFDIAIICASTANVEKQFLKSILRERDAVADLVQCFIMIEETSYTAEGSPNTGKRMRYMHHHGWIRLSQRLYPSLVDEITTRSDSGLSDGIGRTWSDFNPSGTWTYSESGSWVTTESIAKLSTAQNVHYNLLTGELLVDGLPLSRLPAQYENSLAYKLIFGNATIEAMPTNRPGMQFSGLRKSHGHTVYFGMQNEGGADELLLTITKDGDTYDLIPRRVLQDVVPEHFLREYTHWYHRRTRMVEFRPLASPWKAPPTHWRLARIPSSVAPGWTMQKGANTFLIINRGSRTSREISRIFASVESVPYMHAVFEESEGVLHVQLPRLKLTFDIRERSSTVSSREFRGMRLDTRTRTGTLVGLASKIVLRSDQDNQLLLVPNGTVAWTSTGTLGNRHVSVSITAGTSTKVHPYHIDTRLGRIVDNGSVQSRLHLCYLHALTSYCLPDELTQKTGTEQALEILGSAAIRSAARLTPENIQTLHAIAELVPTRTFYPREMRVMQRVQWDERLSFLSQHGLLRTKVRSLLDHAASLEFYHTDKLEGLDKYATESSYLLKRDLIRSSTFYRSGFGAELFTTEDDKTYTMRSEVPTSRLHSVFTTSSRIVGGLGSLQNKPVSSLPTRLWDLFVNTGYAVEGRAARLQVPVAYDADRLVDWKKSLTSGWCQIHRILGTAGTTYNKFQVLMFLATMAFSRDIDMEAIQVLVAMYTRSEVGLVENPTAKCFILSAGRKVVSTRLKDVIYRHSVPFDRTPEACLPTKPYENKRAASKRRHDLYDIKIGSAVSELVTNVADQWPCKDPVKPSLTSGNSYINVTRAMEALRPLFKDWWNNRLFYLYLEDLCQAVSRVPVSPLPGPDLKMAPPAAILPRPRAYTTEADLLSGSPGLDITTPSAIPSRNSAGSGSGSAQDCIPDARKQQSEVADSKLAHMMDRLATMAAAKHEHAYVEDLRKSVDCIASSAMPTAQLPAQISERDLRHRLQTAEAHLHQVYDLIVDATIKSGPLYKRYAGPKASPALFLRQLSRSRWPALSPAWKEIIVAYGRAMTDVQRAERAYRAWDNKADLARELGNVGHSNWDPIEHPEWLLIEVEGGILIRDVQIDIAEMMRNPPSQTNAAMQLNMGEGKSSVIVPIVAAALADTTRLVRVIVGKPQSKQMLQMLVHKLAGLCNRQIYHMPFSRSLVLSEGNVNTIGQLYRECMARGGIMLVQPEHILSFQLMGIESSLLEKPGISQSVLDTQRFFDTCARDIVDESDENFSVKFELIYTMGAQNPVELSPERWTLIQAVLQLVAEEAVPVSKLLPQSVEIDHSSAVSGSSFPRLRLVREDAQQLVCLRVAKRICSSGLQGLPIGRQRTDLRAAVLRYITEAEPSPETILAVESSKEFWTQAIAPRVHLLRGLLGQGVLGFAFGQKRWRVNYGLDGSRKPPSRLAVPFRAKDSPAPRSEFSHPDVVIVLTCLSYYYGGLADNSLFAAFEHLLRSDQAGSEYSDWVRNVTGLPEAFRHLSGINLKDRFQCTEHIFPHLRHVKAVVDYFLAHIVFTKEMKEFPYKLSASGWDIGKTKTHPTTGFSGTSDAQHLLPLSVRHLDLDKQRHTNALVLQYLLQPENKVVHMPPVQSESSDSTDAERLLDLIVGAPEPIQVILDAGAQILELVNIEVVRTWLAKDTSGNKQAAVFFGDNDELSILDRNGHVESFQTSPYAQQLDQCLIFLDEAHTRGIDLKLPEYYRAAMTLGANLTKDRLVQACMRMRKLGKGQSVVFFVPTEIQTKIATLMGSDNDAGTGTSSVSDVLVWSIHETYADLRRSIPLWAVQGERFIRQRKIWDEVNPAGLGNGGAGKSAPMSVSQAEKFQEEEAMSLEKHYSPRKRGAGANDPNSVVDLLSKRGHPESSESELGQIYARCEKFDAHLHFGAAALHEEQERELSPEIEQEIQIERPHPMEPARHNFHADVKKFALTGQISRSFLSSSSAFMPAFASLAATSAAQYLSVSQFPRDGLLVTADFAQTVQVPKDSKNSQHTDAYQRPVQWVLASRDPGDANVIQTMVLISPYEAQNLLPTLRAMSPSSAKAHLHLYAPRSSLAYEPLDDLRLYTVPLLDERPDGGRYIPDRLTIQLNLFAGQLYFSSLVEYKNACDMLGLAWRLSQDDSVVVSADGFIVSGRKMTTFTKSPTAFLNTLFTKIRWNCESIDKTHWGKVFGGQFLQQRDIEDGVVKDEDEDEGEFGDKEGSEAGVARLSIKSEKK